MFRPAVAAGLTFMASPALMCAPPAEPSSSSLAPLPAPTPPSSSPSPSSSSSSSCPYSSSIRRELPGFIALA